MSKSFKLKNNTYLDSKSVIHNKQTLYDMFTTYYWNLEGNEECVYNKDFEYLCTKIGNTIFLNIHCVAFKTDGSSCDWFIKNLPKPKYYNIGYLTGGKNLNGENIRFGITTDGYMCFHYTYLPHYGDAANIQYYGFIMYEAA